jgi:hypothetical protein
MNKLIKYFKRVDGQSLAEFAVTTAMMATLATTAAPKFSGVGEGAKEKKTLSDIDKIMKSANNFYNEQVTKSGRGRFPGQAKYNDPVPTGGGYLYSATEDQSDAEAKVKEDLQGLDSNSDGDYDDTGDIAPSFYAYNNDTEAALWASVFGTLNDDALAPSGSNINPIENPSSDYYSDNEVTPGLGAEEFLEAFGGDAIKSPFQDGHYIYTVIAGKGSGSQSIAPIIFVADLESPSSFWKKLQP